MPVQLGVNVQRGATAAGFNEAISKAVGDRGVESSRNTLLALQRYIKTPEGGVRAGSIRIVNTTNQNELSFRYKTFGWGPQYRKERTEQALVALLSTAGVANAHVLVDNMVRQGGGRVQAQYLDQLLNSESVKSVIHPLVSTLGFAKGELISEGGGLETQIHKESGIGNPSQRAHSSQGQPPHAQPPLQVNAGQPEGLKVGQALPPKPMVQQRTPEQLRQEAGRLFEQKRMTICTSAQAFGTSCLINFAGRSSPYFKATMAQTGERAEYRDFAQSPIPLAPGAELMENDYIEFNQSNPHAPDEFRPPQLVVVRAPDAQGNAALAFHLVDLKALPDHLQGVALEVWATITTTGEFDPNHRLKAQAQQAVAARQPPQDAQHLQQSVAARPAAKPNNPNWVKQTLNDQLGLAPDGQQVGQGGFGAVYPAQFEGRPVMFKMFLARDPIDRQVRNVHHQVLDGERTGPSNAKLSEAYAAYLEKASDKAWKKPDVLTPTHYVVRHDTDTGPRYEAIAAADIKARSRDRTLAPNGLQCIGLIMPRAPGVNLRERLSQGPLSDPEFGRLARSGLNTARALNARGWVHRDLKPDNMNLDDQGAHVFDTGLGYKFQKTPAQRAQAQGKAARRAAVSPPLFREAQPGTPGYLHPATRSAAGGGSTWPVGTQIDLHAWGLIFMRAKYPALRPGDTLARFNQAEQGTISYSQLDEALRRVINEGTHEEVEQARNFRADRKKEGTAAHFISRCLELADEVPAVKWADRAYSDGLMAELAKHPAIQ